MLLGMQSKDENFSEFREIEYKFQLALRVLRDSKEAYAYTAKQLSLITRSSLAFLLEYRDDGADVLSLCGYCQRGKNFQVVRNKPKFSAQANAHPVLGKATNSALKQLIEKNKSVVFTKVQLKRIEPEADWPEINSLLAMPVVNHSGKPYAILVLCNSEKKYTVDYAQQYCGFTSSLARFLAELNAEHSPQPALVVNTEQLTHANILLHQLTLEQLRFNALSEIVPLGVLQTDADWHTSYVNPQWLEICGLTEDDVVDLGWAKIFYGEVEDMIADLHAEITKGKVFRTDCQVRKADDSIIWAKLYVMPLVDMDDHIQGFLATLADDTYYRTSENRLREMAELDELTKLPNRAALKKRLDQAIGRIEKRGALSLLSLDLDGFKNINDSMGHDAGDELLTEVSGRIKSVIRKEDFLTRFGGDEFIILLEKIPDAEIVSVISSKILDVLSQPFTIGQQEVFISASIGICFAVSGKKTKGDILLKQADMALYRAKAHGRNNYQYYTPELDAISRERLELANGLHIAVKRKEFVIYYQMQADVQSNELIGFEALLRWHHPKRGIIPPLDFIPLLEEIGLIISLGQWILRETFKQLRYWIDKGWLKSSAIMSVNLSPRQFRDPNLISGLKAALDESKLSGENIVIEITENTLVQDNQEMLGILQEFKALGIKVALDDFGTGYASLSHLKKFPIDILKIDRSFVKDILDDEDDVAISEAVLALASALDLEVIAEGVETKAILKKLNSMGCDTYQGYLLNKPMPAATIEAMWHQ